MAITSNTYTGNGSNKLFSITFPYLDTTDIDVSLNGVLQTVTTQYSFANATTIEFVTAPSNGAVVLLDRSTDDTALQATFFPGSSIKASDLNYNFDQVLYLSQETANSAANQSTAGLQAQITAANNTSNTALTTANSANVTANAANTTANGIAGTANTALTTANAAEATANGIAATANTALANSTAAVATANTALPLAGGTMTGNLNTPSLNGGQLAGTRNRIINGDMLISQRYPSSSPTFGIGSTYVLDRWYGTASSASNMRVGISTDVPTGAGFISSQKADAVTGTTLIATSNHTILQRIEGYNVSDLGFGTASAATVTLSFWVKSSITGTHSGSLRNSGFNRSYPFTYSISAANTWEKKTITIPGDTTGTWLKDSGIGIEVIFDLGTGSTFRSTAGAWTAGNFVGVTGAASVMATAGANWFITGVQFEPGTIATPYERLEVSLSALRCFRYYASAPVGTFVYNTTQFSSAQFPVVMRAVPTVTVTSGTVAGLASFGFHASGAGTSGAGYIADAEL
jgi:hypothetical protein